MSEVHNDDVCDGDDLVSVEALLQLFTLFEKYRDNFGIIPTKIVRQLLMIGGKGESFATAGIAIGQLGRGYWATGPDLKKAIGKRFTVLGEMVEVKGAAQSTPAPESEPIVDASAFPPDWQQLANWELAWAAHFARCSVKTIRRAVRPRRAFGVAERQKGDRPRRLCASVGGFSVPRPLACVTFVPF